MLEKTEEQIAQEAADKKVMQDAVNEAVDQALEKARLTDILKGFPLGDADPGGKLRIGATEEEKVAGDPKGGFKALWHFFRDVARADGRPPSEELSRWQGAVGAIGKTAGYLEESDLSQGGYLVPVEFREMLLRETLEEAIVRPRATVVPMATNRLEIPALVDADHSSNFFGGILPTRRAEKAALAETSPKFGKVALTLHEISGLCYITNELLVDSPISMEPIVTTLFRESILFMEDDDFLNGDGAAKALGAFNAANPSLVSVTKETNQADATIVFENIVKMRSRLFPRARAGSVWLANHECEPQLATMSLAVGTGGIPVYMPAGGASDRPYDSLMGRPLIFTEKMQALGTAGDIGLASFGHYLIGQKAGGIQMATSMHVRFLYNEMAYRFILRGDGQPWWLSALTPKRGSNDLSPFVRLGARP